MFTAKKLPTTHRDLIHDVSYDFYGRRMATCSSDQSVQVRMYVRTHPYLSMYITYLGMGYG